MNGGYQRQKAKSSKANSGGTTESKKIGAMQGNLRNCVSERMGVYTRAVESGAFRRTP
jgi:hypothetical protein